MPAKQRHNAITYTYLQQQFARRKKGSQFKSILSDCRLYDRGTHFEITHNKFERWDNDNGRSEWAKVTKEVSLATITPDDVLTMTYNNEVTITVCNRLTSLTGWPVRLNKREYDNYQTHVRVYCHDGWRTSEPYFDGMQWDVKNGGAVPLNKKPDLKIVVDNTKVQQAKREFDAIRKLCRVSAKIGAFDEFAETYMFDRWLIPLNKVKSIDEINTTDPEFDDAYALVCHGGYDTQRPDRHYWDHKTKQYLQRDMHELKREWLAKCVENGLKQLRREFYKANDAYVQIAA